MGTFFRQRFVCFLSAFRRSESRDGNRIKFIYFVYQKVAQIALYPSYFTRIVTQGLIYASLALRELDIAGCIGFYTAAYNLLEVLFGVVGQGRKRRNVECQRLAARYGIDALVLLVYISRQ